MCGLLGYVGSKDPVEVCVKGLSFLEYRGYDSSGVAGVGEDKLEFRKETGKIHNLEKAVSSLKKLRNAIAHTRWATHGRPTRENAHPHLDASRKIAVVHNGIIENHAPLRKQLETEGYTFQSDTDSEIIVQLIAKHYSGNLRDAVSATLEVLEGFWAIAAIHQDYPDLIIAAAKENPLALGINAEEGEVYLSSDINALSADELEVLYLQEGEIAEVRPGEVKLFDSSGKLVQRAAVHTRLKHQDASKNGYEHYMLKEIFEQPDAMRRALHGRLHGDSTHIHFDELAFRSSELKKVEKILILGCGTSWHAGCLAASWIEELVKIPCQVEIASEYRYKDPVIAPNTLALAISQSGETFDTMAASQAMMDAGVPVIALCNVDQSTLARRCSAHILLKAGPEFSVCSTKAFTSQLTSLFLFSLYMAEIRGLESSKVLSYIDELQKIPLHVESVLRQKAQIEALAQKYTRFKHFFFLGRNYMFPTALEGALKLKEISYIHATAYPSGEMKHGSIALVDDELAVIGLLANKKTLEKSLSNLMEVKARGARILALAEEGTTEVESIAEDTLFLPKTIDELSCISSSVAMQLLAYYVAKTLGTDIDQPKNLAKCVTVE